MFAIRNIVASVAVLVVALGLATECASQDLIDFYRVRRIESLSARIENILLIPRKPTPLGRRPADLAHWPKSAPDQALPDPRPAVTIVRSQKVPKLGRHWFREKFPDLRWTYEGSNEVTPLDTLQTREIRARMQAHFGSPTQTLPDQGLLRGLKLDEFVQFEYWFVLNDSIPLVVLDVNGPFERGIVAATEEHFQNILISLRDTFLYRLIDDPIRKPYADYYYEEDLATWFLTGFDGKTFFLTPVDPRRIAPGRPVVPGE